MTVSTLDPSAGVILTAVVKALALVLADVGSGTKTFILATLAFDAAFAVGTTIGGTGALHTTAFFASFAIRAGGTGLDTLAVRGIAELVFSTVTIDTEVGDTLAVVAEFSVFTASGVASGRDTLAVDADGRAGTITVVLTNAITATLTIATSLAVGTFDTSAGVRHTTVDLTDATGFAGRTGAFVIATGAIAKRAGALCPGHSQVEQMLRKEEGVLLLIANDASEGVKTKFQRWSLRNALPVVELLSKDEIAHSTGLQPTSLVMVQEEGFSRTLRQEAWRAEKLGLARYHGPQPSKLGSLESVR